MDRGASGVIFAVAIAAALLLVAAEFTTLYHIHFSTKTGTTQSVTAGSHNSYATLPIAALAAALGFGIWRTGSRLMLLAVGVLGVIALLIALLHDLPDAHAVGLANNNSVSATTTPSVGLYLETLGAILLVGTSGLGSLIVGWPRRRRRTASSRRREE